MSDRSGTIIAAFAAAIALVVGVPAYLLSSRPEAAPEAVPAPVAAAHLLTARETLSELIGVIDTDDVLDVVFRDFCIGK